jgi:Response regulator containing CheY-like receiver, AAA-type ATPase, and DNA-binding domains
MNIIEGNSSAPSSSKPSGKTIDLHNSQCASHDSATRWVGSALIYLVDDEQGLIELYALFLQGAGHRVRMFKSRADALSSLMADSQKPDLLVTDCLGDAMPIHLFIQRCRMVHPELRILMASGISEDDVRSYCLRPDRFLGKPFTADRFVREVSAALAG